MHYYKRNIGDYHKKAGRLTMLQHGSYTLLMDSCYDREQFPTEEEAIEWVWASNQDEIDAVLFVLKRFFTLEDDVYTQKRIKEDLERYQQNSSTNQRIALEREAKRRDEKEQRVHGSCDKEHEPPPNHKPLTTNQEPLTINQKPVTKSYTPFDDFWDIYPKHVDKKKAEIKWDKLKVDDELFNKIKNHLAMAYITREKQHIPGPLPYLNGEKWDDEIIQTTEGKNDGQRSILDENHDFERGANRITGK